MKKGKIFSTVILLLFVMNLVFAFPVLAYDPALGKYTDKPTGANVNPGVIDTSSFVMGNFLGLSATQPNATAYGDSGVSVKWDDNYKDKVGDPNTNGDQLDGKYAQIVLPQEGWWDLGFATDEVAVFPSQDHGPYLKEGLEFIVYGSNTPWSSTSEQAILTDVYLDGWRPHNVAEDANRNGWCSDDISSVYKFKQKYRYVRLTALAPQDYNEPEIDAVAGKLKADSLSLTSNQVKIQKRKSSEPIKVVATYVDGSKKEVTDQVKWKSQNEQVAIVSGGVITGVGEGKTQVVAEFSGVISTPIDVEVVDQEVVTLGIKLTSSTLFVGDKSSVQAIATYADGYQEDVSAKATWTTNKPELLKMDGATLEALAEGTAIVSVAYAGKTASTVVTILPEQNEFVLDISPDTLKVEVGKTRSIQLVAKFEDGLEEDVTLLANWSSSDPAVASVELGSVTGETEGKAVITATYRGASVQAAVTVIPAPPDVVKLEAIPNKLTVVEGEQETIKLVATYKDKTQEVVTDLAEWIADNEDIATVENGVITGVKDGDTFVTAAFGDREVQINVAVKALVSLQVTPSNVSMKPKTKKPVKLYGVFKDGKKIDVSTKVTWTSDKPYIADIKIEGGRAILVAGSSKGSAVVTATYANKTATLSVKVK